MSHGKGEIGNWRRRVGDCSGIQIMVPLDKMRSFCLKHSLAIGQRWRCLAARHSLAFCWVMVLWWLSGIAGFSAPYVIDDFAYTNSAEARLLWPTVNGPPVVMATSGEWGPDQVMNLPCDFAVRETRCYWDRSVSVNLAGYTDFALEIYVPDPGAVDHFTLYFRSGAGWYGCYVSVSGTGWQTLRFSKARFTMEGNPSGWNQIDRVRLSPWKGASRNTILSLRELRAYTPPVLMIRDEATSNPAIVDQTIDRHIEWLGRYHIECGVVTRTNVEAGLLAQSRLAVLPYNENISPAEWTALESFVAAGGKLLVYYLLPARMENLLGIRRTGWAQGDYAAWVFADPSIAHLPPKVRQASWNITYAIPNGTLNARVSATWEDSQGVSTGRAAWLTSDHGLFMSHVLLSDDPDRKAYCLLALIGHFLPEVWEQAAIGAIDEIGCVGPYRTYPEADAGIRREAETTLRAPTAETALTMARTYRELALEAFASREYAEAVAAAESAHSHLERAYSLSLSPVTPEFRAIWEHHATGPYPGDWPRAIDALTNHGFNAVFPNMLWGGLAHYNSAYLPRSTEFTTYGDQIAACVSAAHARGVQVHVWKVNYNLSGAPQPFIDNLRAANRTQVSQQGEPIDWLCPSHPDNFALETDSLLEVVRNYDVDGIHFDYIRYPGSSYCFCTGCLARFQAETGLTVPTWPADVLSTGALRNAFLDWRRNQITRLVTTVYAQVKALKPGVQVSAAVFPDANSAFNGVGQDWRQWVTNGILDFICPMDYTTSLDSFTNLVARQLESVAGRVPVYPGIGAFLLEPDGFLAQLQAARSTGLAGFIAFELSPSAVTDLLPTVRDGATAPDEPDTDNDLLADSWELHWFGTLTVAGTGTDVDHDGSTDLQEYVMGSDPTRVESELTLQARLTEGAVEVSFTSRAVTSPGYQNAERRYRLESTLDPGRENTWESEPGYADQAALVGVENVVLSIPTVGIETRRFFRVRVWLQQKEP